MKEPEECWAFVLVRPTPVCFGTHGNRTLMKEPIPTRGISAVHLESDTANLLLFFYSVRVNGRIVFLGGGGGRI